MKFQDPYFCIWDEIFRDLTSLIAKRKLREAVDKVYGNILYSFCLSIVSIQHYIACVKSFLFLILIYFYKCFCFFSNRCRCWILESWAAWRNGKEHIWFCLLLVEVMFGKMERMTLQRLFLNVVFLNCASCIKERSRNMFYK